MQFSQRITHTKIKMFVKGLKCAINEGAYSNFIVMFENYLKFLNNEEMITPNANWEVEHAADNEKVLELYKDDGVEFELLNDDENQNCCCCCI